MGGQCLAGRSVLAGRSDLGAGPDWSSIAWLCVIYRLRTEVMRMWEAVDTVQGQSHMVFTVTWWKLPLDVSPFHALALGVVNCLVGCQVTGHVLL